MKHKYLFTLIVLILGSIPFPVTSAQALTSITHPVNEALDLMYFSDAILTPEIDIDDSPDTSGLNSPFPRIKEDLDTGDLLARIIHAKKMERNDQDANCKLLQAYYQGQGKECEAREVKAFCDKRRGEINTQISFYHKMRGDRRKVFTKFWHSIKRSSSNFWHRIGPVGRNFLRNMEKETFQVVASGGSLSGGVLKNLIKHQAKAMGRERIRQVVFAGVQRLLQGQIQIAQAAGLDICQDEQEETTTETQSVEQPKNDEWVDIGSFLGIPRYWSCTSKSGYWGAWMQTNGTIVDKSELIFNLDAQHPSPNYEFKFDGIARISLSYASGNVSDYAHVVHHSAGRGTANWDDSEYFYGSVDIERSEVLTYPDSDPNPEEKASWERAVTGALSQDHKEIHICFHEYTKEQFDSIQHQPFEDLRPNCHSNNYFICVPK